MTRLRKYRERSGLRREELALRAGISFEYICKLESKNPPTPGLAIARRLAAALGASLDDLFPVARAKATA